LPAPQPVSVVKMPCPESVPNLTPQGGENINRESDFTPRRFVGIDLPKHFVVVAAVDATQQVLLKPRRIDLDDFPAWAEAHLGPKDAAVLEATGNAWYVYDLLAPLVGRCVVTNPIQAKWIAAAAVKLVLS
jgi:hypothetical protein